MFTEVISDRGNGPPLIYVPGIDGSGQLLQNTAGQLEESFRLIRVRYSLGVSSQHHTYSHLAGSLIETVSLRGIDRMSLLGESFGALLPSAPPWTSRIESKVSHWSTVFRILEAFSAGPKSSLGPTHTSMDAQDR